MVAPMTPEQFVAEMAALGINVSRETLQSLVAYERLLTKWQARINLVGPDTLPDIWRRHFLDSAQLYPLLPPVDPANPDRALKIFDLGSGAGFPALVLAALAAFQPPDQGGRPLDLHLIESDRRKSVFLAEAARAMHIDSQLYVHVRIRSQRAEQVEAHIADTITARALAPLDKLLALAARFADAGTIFLFPKGRNLAPELIPADKAWKMQREIFPSRSDAGGVILRITGLEKR